MKTQQTYKALIITIFHFGDPYPYTIRSEESGLVLAGFKSIADTDHWLKTNGGKFTTDPVETDKGYHRKAQIPTWLYYHQVNVAEQKAA